MIRISSIFLLSFLPAILCAQTYVVKIFLNANFSEIEGKKISDEMPTIEISKENQEEFLEWISDKTFAEIQIEANSKFKSQERIPFLPKEGFLRLKMCKGELFLKTQWQEFCNFELQI